MTDYSEAPTEDNPEEELIQLKQMATTMGIKFSPNIGLDKLREKVQQHNLPDLEIEEDNISSVKLTEFQKNEAIRKECSRLIRIRVTCMNPDKKDWNGEIFTVRNAKVSELKKFVPFNVEAGWHVPFIIYQMMKERKYTMHYEAKNAKGEKVNKHKLVPEFNIEVLDPLTEEEIQELVRQQAMSRSLED